MICFDVLIGWLPKKGGNETMDHILFLFLFNFSIYFLIYFILFHNFFLRGNAHIGSSGRVARMKSAHKEDLKEGLKSGAIISNNEAKRRSGPWGGAAPFAPKCFQN